MKRKRNQTFESQNNDSGAGGGGAGMSGYHDNHTLPPVQEAEGSFVPVPMQMKGYFGGREYHPAPQELPAQNRVHEIGS